MEQLILDIAAQSPTLAIMIAVLFYVRGDLKAYLAECRKDNKELITWMIKHLDTDIDK